MTGWEIAHDVVGIIDSEQSRQQFEQASKIEVDGFAPNIPFEPKPIRGPIKLNERYSDCFWGGNSKDHHTEEYIRKDKSIVVRRGQPIRFTAKLNRCFNADRGDVIKIVLRYGDNPSLTDGSLIIVSRIELSEEPDPYEWSFAIVGQDRMDGTTTMMTLNSPANAFIGRYKCAIYLQTGEDYCVDEEPDLIFLCNPWNEKDETYLEGADAKEEYVLNEHGTIFRGSSSCPHPYRWNFGQFEEDILDVALYLINRDPRIKGKKGLQKLRDPVWLSRILSAATNSNDDRGVLVGNWKGDYDGGVNPCSWSGSVKILQQYWKTRCPVKYGQCWVFSGLMTTLLRSIGIPTRSITNYASAHDHDNSMTIDHFVDINNREVENLRGDSKWNYHVWNEIWIRGTGHWPASYAGWAAVDSTPQEESRGLKQCGPAPLKAIKEGETYVGYDTGFIFGEVNGDEIVWVVEQGRYVKSMSKRYTRAVGKNISTKAIGSNRRQSLTDDYKYREGTKEERDAFKTAYAFGSRPSYFNKFLDCEKAEHYKWIDIRFELEPKIPQNGEDLKITIKVRNNTGNTIISDMDSALRACLYTGETRKLVATKKAEYKAIPAHDSLDYSMVVPCIEYGDKFADAQMAMHLDTIVKTGGKTFTEKHEFQFFNSSSAVQIEFENNRNDTPIGHSLKGCVIFTNPLDINLTHLTVTIEGAGLTKPRGYFIPGGLKPREATKIPFEITPYKKGKRMLIVDVDSNQVRDLKGYAEVDVLYPEPR